MTLQFHPSPTNCTSMYIINRIYNTRSNKSTMAYKQSSHKRRRPAERGTINERSRPTFSIRMRSTTDHQRIQRRCGRIRNSRRQPSSLSLSQTTILLVSAQAFFICQSIVNGWSSPIRIVSPTMKTTSKWLTSAASRRSSLITSLLEPPTTFPSMASKSVPSTSRPIQMAFDLQMKHSTQSRSRIYPTNGDKHLTTSSRSGASSGEARMTQNHDHPSMFLAGQFFPTASLVSPSGVDYNNRSSRTGVENSDGLTAAIPQQRGVLGFDVFELDAVRTAGGGKKEESQRVNPTKRQRRNSSTSRLQISRTNIDMDTWNNNGEISWEEDREGSRTVMSPTDNCFFPTPGLNWRNSPLSVPSGGSPLSSPGGHSTFNVVSSTQGFSSSSSPVRLLQHSLPAWFPWIPTKSQIESLKVNELREACIQRGLAKVRRRRHVLLICLCFS